MIRCGKCGRDNAEGMRFCTNCGAPLSTAEPVGGTSSAPESSQETLSFSAPPPTSPTGWPTVGSYMPPPPQQAAGTARERKNTGLIVGIIAALVLGVVAAGAGVGWYLYSNSKEEVANKNTKNGNERAEPSPSATNANARPTPEPSPSFKSFEPPATPTKEGTFTVYANEGWQLSNIAVVPYEEYTTKADGIVDLAGAKAGVRADGVNDPKLKGRRLFAEYPTGALLMRTRYADGRFSNTVAARVNGNWQNLPDERGMLEFAVNDNDPKNNGGQFTVRVKLTKVPKNK